MLNTLDLIFGASGQTYLEYQATPRHITLAPIDKGGGGAANTGQTRPAPVPATKGALHLDLLSMESYQLPSLATQYPVEQGMPISDGIIPQSARLTITGAVSSANATLFRPWNLGLRGISRLEDTVKLLEELHTAHLPVTVVTGLHVYPNMAMTGCEINRGITKDGESQSRTLKIKLDFLQIRIVQADVAVSGNAAAEVSGKTGSSAIPAGKAQSATPPPSLITRVATALGLTA
ncbi:Hypothetical protein GbCGDNIH6_1569 [Granulibacter bethesdensis]|uniref:phage baseplate protein n=1 Tax=Granulibacter bethesdensis TaxID=364410 RepID=UPI00090BF3EF|nr:hypothetical protein [Granulibacter bethesdensis]APH57391.1 Hypothetical protein GbCGDNIH6_1569 [Granulibacter bethesdensis]